jgi:hypothetical protein
MAPDDDTGREVFFFNARLTPRTLTRAFRETERFLFAAEVVLDTYHIVMPFILTAQKQRRKFQENAL